MKKNPCFVWNMFRYYFLFLFFEKLSLEKVKNKNTNLMFLKFSFDNGFQST